ncbi:PIG-L family deacetylase [Streptomyces sp. NPDC046876]|uniref:PIG-L family deacetylase n=1 Tax=Streptomyces sp. NPDC046876 TaxID=3155616 RepID=UPI0033DA0002
MPDGHPGTGPWHADPPAAGWHGHPDAGYPQPGPDQGPYQSPAPVAPGQPGPGAPPHAQQSAPSVYGHPDAGHPPHAPDPYPDLHPAPHAYPPATGQPGPGAPPHAQQSAPSVYGHPDAGYPPHAPDPYPDLHPDPTGHPGPGGLPGLAAPLPGGPSGYGHSGPGGAGMPPHAQQPTASAGGEAVGGGAWPDDRFAGRAHPESPQPANDFTEAAWQGHPSEFHEPAGAAQPREAAAWPPGPGMPATGPAPAAYDEEPWAGAPVGGAPYDPGYADTGHPGAADPASAPADRPGSGRAAARRARTGTADTATADLTGAAEAAAPRRRARTDSRTAEAESAADRRVGRRAARRARGDAGEAPDGARRGQGDGVEAAPRAARRAPGGGRAGGGRVGRRLVKAVGFVAAVAAGSMLVLRGNEALGGLSARPEPPAKPALAGPAGPAEAPDPGRVLQIVAHPDDDLYFMNPDLRYSIAAGHPVTTVYLTSGEADGINAGEAKQASTPANKPAYAEARQNGIRAAYAAMATGDRTSAWKRTTVPTRGGGQAEVDVLVAKPEVNLVWLQMREAGNVYDDVPDSLRGLWNERTARLESALASGSPVKQRFSYSKDQVVRTLVGVLEQYKPTTVRAQDPTPGRFPDTKRYTDHQDHFYGARFVQAALAAYAKDVKDRPHFAVQNYVGYFNGSLPSALDPDEAKRKLDIMEIYAWRDKQNHCGSGAGCGDLKVADHPAGNNWTSSINYARGTGTSWLASDKDHGLWAFKVLDGQVALWHRAGPIGPWSGPDLLPGTGMDPGISTVALPDGRIAAFGTRTSFGARPADYRREVVYAVQKAPGAKEFGDWQSLGTPEAADDTWTSDISAPAVSADGTGRLAAYVRDGAGTLRGRVQGAGTGAGTGTGADGGWGPWERYGGTDLHGTPATATDGAGRRMVFAATTKTVTAWAQPKPGAPLGPAAPTGLPDTTLPITAEGREGGVRLWFRKPGSGNVRTALVTGGDGGPKVNNLTDLGGLQGFGAVAASGHVLAGRSAGGQLGSDLGQGRAWERSGLMFVGAPSAAMTGRNTVSLAVVGLDARLYVTSSTDEGDAYLAPWQPVGPRNAGR